MAAWRSRRLMAARGPSLARSNFLRRSSKRRRRASSASMARRVCSLMRPSYSWNPRAVACRGRAARKPRMYSSATTSSSASGFREEELGEADGFDEGGVDGFEEGDGDGDEASAEGEGEGEGDALAFGAFGAGRFGEGEGEGEGEGADNGFTGPVGFSGAEGAGLGVAVGEGAAGPEDARPRLMVRAKTAQRNLMAIGWIGRSVGRGRDGLRRGHSHRARDCPIHQAPP